MNAKAIQSWNRNTGAGTVQPLMSAMRISAEHDYEDIKQFWIRKDFSRNLKVWKVSISLLYQSSILLLDFSRMFLWRMESTISV